MDMVQNISMYIFIHDLAMEYLWWESDLWDKGM
jgi:hypothetical protein